MGNDPEYMTMTIAELTRRAKNNRYLKIRHSMPSLKVENIYCCHCGCTQRHRLDAGRIVCQKCDRPKTVKGSR
jgi:hypothetical protein